MSCIQEKKTSVLKLKGKSDAINELKTTALNISSIFSNLLNYMQCGVYQDGRIKDWKATVGSISIILMLLINMPKCKHYIGVRLEPRTKSKSNKVWSPEKYFSILHWNSFGLIWQFIYTQVKHTVIHMTCSYTVPWRSVYPFLISDLFLHIHHN